MNYILSRFVFHPVDLKRSPERGSLGSPRTADPNTVQLKRNKDVFTIKDLDLFTPWLLLCRAEEMSRKLVLFGGFGFFNKAYLICGIFI